MADYGGVLNGVLCGIHCAAGPLLLAWWGSHRAAAVSGRWELGFLGLSGALAALATWRQPAGRLRGVLWALFAVVAASALLAERWPGLELVQYTASAGLITTHWWRQRRPCP